MYVCLQWNIAEKTQHTAETSSCSRSAVGSSVRWSSGLKYCASRGCQLSPFAYTVPDTDDCLQYLLHFNASSLKSDSLRGDIEAAGALVSSYIPDHTLLVVGRSQAVEALKKIQGQSSRVVPFRHCALSSSKCNLQRGHRFSAKLC